MNEATLYLVRHGETKAKAPDDGLEAVVSGRLDSPLTERGMLQMEVLGEKYRHILFDAVYIAPLIRSRQSAEAFLRGAAQSGVPVTEIDALSEINYGPFEGKPVSEFERAKKAFFASAEGKSADGLAHTFPGSHPEFGPQESYRAAAERFALALKNIAREHPGKTVLVISHSGIMKALQLCGYITSAGARVHEDIPFGEVIIIRRRWRRFAGCSYREK